MKQLFSDYRTTCIALLAIAVINAFAFYTNKRLERISKNISMAIVEQPIQSGLVKNMLTELRIAENSVNAYNLSDDTRFLGDYVSANSNLKKLTAQLNAVKHRAGAASPIIDSVLLENKRCITAIKAQLHLENSDQITRVLDKLSIQVEQLRKKEQAKQPIATTSNEPTETKKKRGFIKNLFKKHDAEKTEVAATSIQTKSDSGISSLAPIKTAINGAKKEQQKIIATSQKREFNLEQNVFTSRTKLMTYFNALEALEIKEKTAKVALANNELVLLKTTSKLAATGITLLLITLAIVALLYVRKRKQYEQMLLNSKLEAERLAKTRESFLANMSHEIKTPLNAIHGFSQVLLESSLNEEQKKQVAIINESSSFLTRIVNNILNYARLQGGAVTLSETNVNLKSELDAMYELLLPSAAKKNNTLVFDHSELTTATHFVDLDKLKQILFNLLSNALKFTENGLVSLKVTQVNKDQTEELSFTVSDTGIGIKKEHLSNLFNEFEQGDSDIQSKFGGTGLGLHISKKIAEMMGGSVSIESTAGNGTTATLVLSLQKDKALTRQKPSAELVKVNLASKTILIADDDNYNRALLSAILRKNGAKILEAANGFAAINLCFIEKPDLIIMDVRMPEMNGIDATAQIRYRGCKVPIIGATAVASTEKIDRCMQAGMNSLLFKPFLITELFDKIEETLQLKPKELLSSDAQPKKHRINFQNILDTTEGDDQLRRELISLFEKNLLEIKSNLRSHLEHGNYEQAYELAHRTIPSCKHFEAHSLLEALIYFEQLKNTTYIDKSKLLARCVELEEEINLVIKALRTSEEQYETREF